MDNRSKILKLVSLSPGIHLRELQRILDVSFNSIRYNAERLANSGEIICEKSKGYSRYFPVGTSGMDRILYSLIQNYATRNILHQLASEKSLSNKQISERTGLAKSTVSEHIHRLLSSGLVSITLSSEGNFKVQLVNREHVTTILDNTRHLSRDSGIVSSFTDLWDF